MAHNAVEVLRSHIPIPVEVSLRENLLNLIVGKVFSQLDSHMLELLRVDPALPYKKGTLRS